MSFVLDASLVLSNLLGEEGDRFGEAVRLAIEGDGGIVPQHMILEVLTGVMRAGRTGRITPVEVDIALQKLAAIFDGLEVDSQTAAQGLTATAALARRHQLSAYDAAYLELAQRRGVALATLDDRLCAAARAEDVALVGAR